eukprot:5462000-Alexandrium_andersonii.AAC.1
MLSTASPDAMDEDAAACSSAWRRRRKALAEMRPRETCSAQPSCAVAAAAWCRLLPTPNMAWRRASDVGHRRRST